MRVFLCFTFVIAACYGSHVKWTDFRGGNIILPAYEHKAQESKWVACEKDESLKITWYRKDRDESLALAFDEGGNCAGAQITILKTEIDSSFINVYKQSKGIYEITKVNGVEAYKSTVLFSSEKTLKKGGRIFGDYEDVALDVYIKVNGKYTLLSKEGCTTARSYTEQRCESKYGLVFSSFTSKSKCNELVPFYAVYDPTDRGHLLGFGWLSFHKVSPTESFFKKVDGPYVKSKFPLIPSCVDSCLNLAVGDVWFSYSSSQETLCSGSNWTESHCKEKKKASSSSSSSDSSSDSDSSSSSSSDSS